MKTRILGLMAFVFLAASIQTITAQRVKVEAVNDDISYYLDLKAIATIFGDSRDLEEFERKINDYDARISNLDLNSDGDVDYLRVIETSENNTHLVVIQAILDKDVYQDVATVVVERDRYRRTYVQIVGDPFIYGDNYIIEPMYYQTPYIVSWFWTPRYHSWYSPYRWGYYPGYYHYRHPLHIDVYLTHIHGCINYSHHYSYNNSWRSSNAYNMYNSVRRNDYSVRYPERGYSHRNADYSNRYEMDKRRNSDYVKMSERSTNNSRYGSGSRSGASDDVYGRSGRQSTEVNSRTENYNRNTNPTAGYGNRSSQNSNDSYRGRNTESYNRTESRNSSSSTNVYKPSTGTRNSEYNKPEVRKNESSQPRTTMRTGDDGNRNSRSSSTVERTNSNQRSSGSTSGRSESSRSSKPDSDSGRGRR